MAAALTDNLLEVAGESSITFMASPGKAEGATSFNIDDATGWPTATAFVVAIRQVDPSGNEIDGTYTEWVGTLSTTTVTLGSAPSPVAGVDQPYAAGSTTQVYIPLSSYRDNLLIQALLTVFNQDMSFKSNLALPSPTITTPVLQGTFSGWVGANESWAYASASTITVPSGAAAKYDVGDYLMLTQSATVKYFIITGVADTVLTVTGVTGAVVANSTITGNAYAKNAPHGFVVGLPYIPVKFSVYIGSDKTISTGTDQKIAYDTADFDTGSNFDIATNHRFTVPTAYPGFYQLDGHAVNSSGSGLLTTAFYKNGVAFRLGDFIQTVSNSGGVNISGLIKLAAGDYIEQFVNSSTGTIFFGSSGQHYTHFSGYLASRL